MHHTKTNHAHRTLEALSNLAHIVFALLRGASLPAVQSRLYALVYGSHTVRNLRFFNYGYHPLAKDFDLPVELTGEPYQAMLYHRVFEAAQLQLGRVPKLILEVACSRGGGLLYASKFFPLAKALIGIDLQPDAIAAASDLRAADGRMLFLAASGHNLPLPSHSVDLLVCVEALMNLNRPLFLQESMRVLLPNGVLATTGSQAGSFDAAQHELKKQAQVCGLKLCQMLDITTHIVQACELDAPRRLILIAQAPWFARSYLRNFLGIPGSQKFQAYKGGDRCYFLAVLQPT